MANGSKSSKGEQGPSTRKVAGKLDEMAKRLAAGRKQFDEQATKPMEYFEARIPLMADRTIRHAGPLAAGPGRTAGVAQGPRRRRQPALKVRMRDLEQEQRQVREALATFPRRHAGAHRQAAREARVGGAPKDGGAAVRPGRACRAGRRRR